MPRKLRVPLRESSRRRTQTDKLALLSKDAKTVCVENDKGFLQFAGPGETSYNTRGGRRRCISSRGVSL